MTDDEIAEALASCIKDGEYSYHQKLPPDDGGFSVSRDAYTIKDGVLFLGEEGWYAYPIDIAKFRAAFGLKRDLTCTACNGVGAKQSGFIPGKSTDSEGVICDVAIVDWKRCADCAGTGIYVPRSSVG